MKNTVNTGTAGAVELNRRDFIVRSSGLAMALLVPNASAKEGRVISINDPFVAHRLNNLDKILRLNASRLQERDIDNNRVLRIKMRTQEYIFAIGEKNIMLSRLSGGYNDKTQKVEVRKVDFSYKLSTGRDTWEIQTYSDIDRPRIMQHIGDIEGVLSREFI